MGKWDGTVVGTMEDVGKVEGASFIGAKVVLLGKAEGSALGIIVSVGTPVGATLGLTERDGPSVSIVVVSPIASTNTSAKTVRTPSRDSPMSSARSSW